MSLKILCTADVHIGRRPSRLPQRVDVAALSCARAWETVVRRAVEERVDLLLVAGMRVSQRARLLDAAKQILVERGAGHFTLDAVAELAGASDGLDWVATHWWQR